MHEKERLEMSWQGGEWVSYVKALVAMNDLVKTQDGVNVFVSFLRTIEWYIRRGDGSEYTTGIVLFDGTEYKLKMRFRDDNHTQA